MQPPSLIDYKLIKGDSVVPVNFNGLTSFGEPHGLWWALWDLVAQRALVGPVSSDNLSNFNGPHGHIWASRALVGSMALVPLILVVFVPRILVCPLTRE